MQKYRWWGFYLLACSRRCVCMCVQVCTLQSRLALLCRDVFQERQCRVSCELQTSRKERNRNYGGRIKPKSSPGYIGIDYIFIKPTPLLIRGYGKLLPPWETFIQSWTRLACICSAWGSCPTKFALELWDLKWAWLFGSRLLVSRSSFKGDVSQNIRAMSWCYNLFHFTNGCFKLFYSCVITSPLTLLTLSLTICVSLSFSLLFHLSVESVRDAIGRKVKLSLRRRVKLEIKGDKTENRVLVGWPLPYWLALSLLSQSVWLLSACLSFEFASPV